MPLLIPSLNWSLIMRSGVMCWLYTHHHLDLYIALLYTAYISLNICNQRCYMKLYWWHVYSIALKWTGKNTSKQGDIIVHLSHARLCIWWTIIFSTSSSCNLTIHNVIDLKVFICSFHIFIKLLIKIWAWLHFLAWNCGASKL